MATVQTRKSSRREAVRGIALRDATRTVSKEELVETAIKFCQTNNVVVPIDAHDILNKAVQLRELFLESTSDTSGTEGRRSEIIKELENWRSVQERVRSPHINTVLWIALLEGLTLTNLEFHKGSIEGQGHDHSLTFDIPEAPAQSKDDSPAKNLAQLINELYEIYRKSEQDS